MPGRSALLLLPLALCLCLCPAPARAAPPGPPADFPALGNNTLLGVFERVAVRNTTVFLLLADAAYEAMTRVTLQYFHRLLPRDRVLVITMSPAVVAAFRGDPGVHAMLAPQSKFCRYRPDDPAWDAKKRFGNPAFHKIARCKQSMILAVLQVREGGGGEARARAARDRTGTVRGVDVTLTLDFFWWGLLRALMTKNSHMSS